MRDTKSQVDQQSFDPLKGALDVPLRGAEYSANLADGK
jgi:hypothetical protein